MDETRRRIMQLEIEREALKKERDESGRKQLDNVERSLAELREQDSRLTAKWQNEKSVIDAIKSLKEQIDAKQTELQDAQRRGELERAARIRYGELPELERQLRDREKRLTELHAQGDGMLREEVTPDEIAEIVSKWTGVPVARMLEGEREKLIKMEERLQFARRWQMRRSGGVGCRAACAGRVGRPESPDRIVPVPRPDRGRQDGVVQGAGGVPV